MIHSINLRFIACLSLLLTLFVVLLQFFIFILPSSDIMTSLRGGKTGIATTNANSVPAATSQEGDVSANGDATGTMTKAMVKPQITSNGIEGFNFPPMVFGHIHMAKTAGTEINGILAQRFERICGHKGYSYDSISFNQRAGKDMNGTSSGWQETLKTPDMISRLFKSYNRGRVHFRVMEEIGYHDCDFISHERKSTVWHELATNIEPWPLELHTPCREPISHLMSQCNYKKKSFNCDHANLTQEIQRCMVFPDRFSESLERNENITLKCFNPIPIEPYIHYMSQFLQPRRILGQYNHRETNKSRNKTNECIWNSLESVKQEVRNIMMHRFPYYRFCSKCMGSKDDLLAAVEP